MKPILQRLDEMHTKLTDTRLPIDVRFRMLERIKLELDFLDEIMRFRREVLTTKKYLMN
jgi:hypothetical protein